MATLTQSRKDELAKVIETASTWVHGPRRAKLLAVAEELRGTDPDEIGDKVAGLLQRPGGGDLRTPPGEGESDGQDES